MATPSVAAAAPRFRVIDRDRTSCATLDQQLPADHPVRTLWAFVQQQDLSAFQGPVKAVQGHPGAPAFGAPLLFALWLYSYLQSNPSAHVLADLCTHDLPYQWLCGGNPVNYHTLADFYSRHGAALRALFVEHIAALRQQGLIELQGVSLDGRKVLAHAHKDHFHREGTLQRHLREAEAHVHRVQAQGDQGSAVTARQRAARQRAARERLRRLRQAVATVQRRQEERRQAGHKDRPPEEARANETDPDSDKMKLANGGYAPAYNVETMTDLRSQLVVTVAVTNQGSDNGQLGVLVGRLQREQQVRPRVVAADSGFVSQEDIEDMEGAGVEVLMPPKNEAKEKAAGRDPYAPKRRDSALVACWRGRMGQPGAQARYRRRLPVAEGVHAEQANRGWRQFRLRGLWKVEVEALWRALALNVSRLLARGLLLLGTVRAQPA